jgi:histidinol-phosphate aminotransferase
MDSVKLEDAPGVYRKLLSQGVIVRPIGGYKLPQHLRVSIGLESENARFLTVLESIVAGRA